MSQWHVNPVGGMPLVAVVAVALLLLLGIFGVPPVGNMTRLRRSVLLGLRLLVLLMVIFGMLRPSLVHKQTRERPATLAIAFDRSRSMQVADGLNGKTRWESLAESLSAAAPALGALADKLEIKLYSFDTELRELDFSKRTIDLGDKPDGAETAIGAALDESLRREANKRLVGVVLMGDGAQRAYAPRDVPPQTPTRRLAELGVPLYTLTFGQARGLGQARDVALKDLVVNQTVYVKNEMVVQGMARLDGFANQKVPVQLLFETSPGKMEVVGTLPVQVTQDGQSVPIQMSYVPQQPGEYKVTLRADKQPGELVGTNNELSTFITVLKGGISALYVEGEPRVDQKFIRRSLDASPDIKVDYVRIAEREPAKRAIDLREQFKRGKYDVYVIGDIDSTMWKQEELLALAEVVKGGAGLLMLGGYHTFGPGGYNATPLRDLLPITMDNFERQGFNERIRPDLHLRGPLKMLPARPFGAKHYVMALDVPDDNMTRWQQLPPLDGANRLVGLKPSAQVLAESPEHHPLLVSMEAGGRVMAFAGDSTWHWWMRGFAAEHKRFWRQMILWLAHKDETSEGAVWVSLPQRRYAPGAGVEFTCGARTPQGEPIPDAIFTVEVTGPDRAKHPVRVSRQGESTTGSFLNTRLAGDYTISVSAKGPGGTGGTARSRFLVYEQDLELDNPAADATLFASLSRMTADAGGESLAPEELAELLGRIEQKPLELEEQYEVKSTPWDTGPFFFVYAAVLITEWFLRKRWGLV